MLHNKKGKEKKLFCLLFSNSYSFMATTYYSVWYMKNRNVEATALLQGTCNLIKAYEAAFSDLSGAVPPFLTIYWRAVS